VPTDFLDGIDPNLPSMTRSLRAELKRRQQHDRDQRGDGEDQRYRMEPRNAHGIFRRPVPFTSRRAKEFRN
jgi:hypothetical protein